MGIGTDVQNARVRGIPVAFGVGPTIYIAVDFPCSITDLFRVHLGEYLFERPYLNRLRNSDLVLLKKLYSFLC